MDGLRSRLRARSGLSRPRQVRPAFHLGRRDLIHPPELPDKPRGRFRAMGNKIRKTLKPSDGSD